MGMRETCGRCGKGCLGFFWKDGVPYCGGASTKGCGQEVGATLTNEADRKAEALNGRAHRLRNFGHTEVPEGSRGEVLKSGKVKVRTLTPAERKRFGLAPAKRKGKATA